MKSEWNPNGEKTIQHHTAPHTAPHTAHTAPWSRNGEKIDPERGNGTGVKKIFYRRDIYTGKMIKLGSAWKPKCNQNGKTM